MSELDTMLKELKNPSKLSIERFKEISTEFLKQEFGYEGEKLNQLVSSQALYFEMTKNLRTKK